MTPAPRLGDAFTGSHAFEAGGRAALARVLGCPAGEIDAAPLGDVADRSYRRRIASALASAAQPRAVLDALAPLPIADIVPVARHLAGGSIDADTCPASLFTALRHHDAVGWRTLLGLRLGDLVRLSGVGPSGAARLLGMAFERGLADMLDHYSGNAARGAARDIALLLAHDDRLNDVLSTLAADVQPAAVREAARRVLLRHASPSTPSSSTAARRAAIDDLVGAAGDARDRAVFVSCEIGLPGSPTGEQLGRSLTLGRERIRQLRVRAAERVLAAATDAPEWLARLVWELRSRVGVAAPADDVAAAVAELSCDLGIAAAGPLLSWLAGPYRTVRTCPGWVAVEPDRLVVATRSALDADGGVRLAAELNDVLAGLGVVAAHRDGWLRACGAVVVDGMVASPVGSPAAVLERLLFAAGRSLTAREMSELLCGDVAEDTVRDVLRRGRRFVPSADRADAFELAEWHPAEPATNGRPARPNGSGARRDPRDRRAPTVAGEQLWLRVTVDAALLAGRPHPAPSHLPAELGLARGQRRTFASRYGPVSIVHDGDDPTIETLRPIALASGAGEGDALALGFGTDGALTVKLLDRSPPAAGAEIR